MPWPAFLPFRTNKETGMDTEEATSTGMSYVNARAMQKSAALAVFLCVCFVLFSQSVHWSSNPLVAGRVQSGFDSEAEYEAKVGAGAGHDDPIPNIVHYVWLLNSTRDNKRFEFRHFLSLYAASTYWNPDEIIIHTDMAEETFASDGEADDKSWINWNRLMLERPNVRVHHVDAPAVAPGTNKTLELIEHKSDFIRTQMVLETGGIYLDWDAHPLRDIRPLLRSGFNSIVGREPRNRVQTGTFMSKKQSLLMRTWCGKMADAFNGAWTHHSNDLLTYLAPRLVPVPNEVLIMDQDAFTPGGFSADEYWALYATHPLAEVSVTPKAKGPSVSMDRFDTPSAFPDWTIDYSATYILHAFSLKRAPKKTNVTGYYGLTPGYIMARQSNLARALYPTVERMLDESLFEVH